MAESSAKSSASEAGFAPPAATAAAAGAGFQMQPVIITQVVQQAKVPQKQDERPWSSGIFGCVEDCGNLGYTICFYPCFICSLANSMGEFCLGPYCFFTGGCGICCCASVFPNPFLVGMRGRLRSQYGIKGSVCNDVMSVWCCECCAAMQMSREIEHWSEQ